jgi:CRISPR-associated protein Cas1
MSLHVINRYARQGRSNMLTTNDFKKKQLLFVSLNQGEKLSFSNDNIVIRDVNNKIKHQSTCYRLFAVFVIGNLSITTGLIQRARRFNFSIVLMTPTYRVYQIIGGPKEGNTVLRRNQYNYAGIELAKQITGNKILNQQNLLKKNRKKTDSVHEAISALSIYINGVENASSLEEIMGFEGSASRIYFKNHFNNIDWKGRKPRVKHDMANALLDIGYTMLFNYIDAILNIYGFDTYCGVMHKDFYMRKSLVCDLVEPFRYLIDDQVKKSFNLGQWKEKDFDIRNNCYILQWKNNAEYVSILMQPIMEKRDDIFLYLQSYYRAFMKNLPAEQFPVFQEI